MELNTSSTFWEDKDPKNTARAILTCFRSRNMYLFDWVSQGSDLNLIVNLWKDLNIDIHRRSPSNLAEFEQYYKEYIYRKVILWVSEASRSMP